jgi:hypothetical protein
MLLRRFKDPNVLMITGMLFLVLADSTRYLVRSGRVTIDHADFVMGLCMGIAIGTLLLSVIKRKRQRSSTM